jgi:hypothetical protein
MNRWLVAIPVAVIGCLEACEGATPPTDRNRVEADASLDATSADAGQVAPEDATLDGGHAGSDGAEAAVEGGGDATPADATPADATPRDATADAIVDDSGPDAHDAGQGDETLDASPDQDADATADDGASDATICPNGVTDLSNIANGDFHISFRIVTTQTGWVALVNQRNVCSYGQFWDVRQCESSATTSSYCPVNGAIYVETDESQLDYVTSAAPINDGQPHDVSIQRVSGFLFIYLDGTLSGTGPSSASFGQLPRLQIGADVCSENGTGAPLTGTLTNLCITKP